MDKTLDELFRKINITITKLAKECEKPNFEKMQSLTIDFKKLIRKSKNYIKSEIDKVENLVPDRLEEYREFTNGLLDAIDHVCSDTYCPEYKKSDKAYMEICSDLKVILKVEVINELDILLPLSKVKLHSFTKLPSRSGGEKKKKKKKTRKSKNQGKGPEIAVMGKGEIHRKQQRLDYLNKKGLELQAIIENPPSPFIDIYAHQDQFNNLKKEWKLLMDKFPDTNPVDENARPASRHITRETIIIEPQTKSSFSVQHGRRRNRIITRNNRIVPNRVANRVTRRRRRRRRNRIAPGR